MKTIVAFLLLCSSAVAGDCVSAFCRVQKAHVVAQVNHVGYAYPQVYYVPYGNTYGQFMSDADKIKEATKQGYIEAMQELGLAPRIAGGGLSIVDTKCAKCHRGDSGNETARNHWAFDSTPLSWKDAARAQDGIVNHDMAKRAGLNDKEQAAIVSELTSYLSNAAKED